MYPQLLAQPVFINWSAHGETDSRVGFCLEAPAQSFLGMLAMPHCALQSSRMLPGENLPSAFLAGDCGGPE